MGYFELKAIKTQNIQEKFLPILKVLPKTFTLNYLKILVIWPAFARELPPEITTKLWTNCTRLEGGLGRAWRSKSSKCPVVSAWHEMLFTNICSSELPMNHPPPL